MYKLILYICQGICIRTRTTQYVQQQPVKNHGLNMTLFKWNFFIPYRQKQMFLLCLTKVLSEIRLLFFLNHVLTKCSCMLVSTNSSFVLMHGPALPIAVTGNSWQWMDTHNQEIIDTEGVSYSAQDPVSNHKIPQNIKDLIYRLFELCL